MPIRRDPALGRIAALLLVVLCGFARSASAQQAPSVSRVPAPPGQGTPATPEVGPHTFPAATHPDEPIEWWYANVHLTTRSKRHLAIVAAFFRFDFPQLPLQQSPAPTPGHYLIYGVTDLDTKSHRFVSVADQATLDNLKVVVPLVAGLHPNDPAAKLLADSVAMGQLPPPHQIMDQPAAVDDQPFRLSYGSRDSFAATNDGDTAYDLALGDGQDKVQVHLAATRPPMAVGGSGETGIAVPGDMHYFSLTRCAVGGTVDTGNGAEPIRTGQGWIDHQWGSSWTTDKEGWDWFGVQLDDGTDILVYELRNLQTGKASNPTATFEDATGRQWTTHKIVFTPDPRSTWQSSATGVTYPLAWSITFPDQRLQLRVATTVQDQEIPILPPASPIWEGSCVVAGSRTTLWRMLSSAEREKLVRSLGKKGADADAYQKKAFQSNMPVARWVSGLGYLELVGYNSTTAAKAR